jgi:predicted PurR-regulated permease PerM
MPTRVRSGTLIALLVLVTLVLLHLAAGVVVPFILAVLLAFALDPVVRGVERVVRSRQLAAGLTVGALVAALAGSAYALSDEAARAADRLPEATSRLREQLREWRSGPSKPLDAIGKAADNVEAAASEATGGRQPPPAARPSTSLGVRDWLIVGSMGLVAFSGQLLLLVFLVYFLLASGDLFKRKIVKIAGPALSARRITVEALDEIQRSLERFVLVILATNAVVGVASFFAFRAMGLANAGVWALLGAVLNTIPYVGPAVTAGVLFLVGLLQFDRFDMALLAAGSYVAITSIEGTLLKPWWMGRIGRLNNPAVFTALLFWGWLWGAWGMLLAYPIMIIIKTVADHVEQLTPVAELLGE